MQSASRSRTGVGQPRMAGPPGLVPSPSPRRSEHPDAHYEQRCRGSQRHMPAGAGCRMSLKPSGSHGPGGSHEPTGIYTLVCPGEAASLSGAHTGHHHPARRRPAQPAVRRQRRRLGTGQGHAGPARPVGRRRSLSPTGPARPHRTGRPAHDPDWARLHDRFSWLSTDCARSATDVVRFLPAAADRALLDIYISAAD
jgi:hypothetical protein